MKRWTSLVLAALFVAVGLVSGVGTAQADDSHCPDGNSCFWTGQSYGGSKVLRGAEWYGYGWQPFDNRKYSVKNRFTNKTIWIYGPQIGYDCGYPGQRADSIPGGVTWFAVGLDCGGQLARYFVS
jgi:peptidase inhibitor family I36